MKRFLLALSFLTILPPGRMGGEITEDDLIASTLYYPLIGALLGVLLSWFAVVAGLVWPPILTAALTVTVWVVLTAGLHMDGLMDTFDGMGVRGDRIKRLTVMRDSCAGAFGVQAAVLVLLLKLAALTVLVPSPRLVPALFLAVVLGRSAMVGLMATNRYAREEAGLGKAFVDGVEKGHFVITAIMALVLAMFAAGAFFWAVVVSQSIVFLLLRFWFARSFGGVTGDTLGAACELHEVSLLLTAAIML